MGHTENVLSVFPHSWSAASVPQFAARLLTSESSLASANWEDLLCRVLGYIILPIRPDLDAVFYLCIGDAVRYTVEDKSLILL